MQSALKATARAGPNIAFLKYWGNRDPTLHIPNNSSLSLTLAELNTITTVEFSPDLAKDEIWIDGAPAAPAAYARVVAHLDLLRSRAGINHRARVSSHNNFPTGVGLAASASGFAALTLASAKALGLALDERELSRLARRGSGSAARSILGGYVELLAGTKDGDSYAQQVAPQEHWQLLDLIALVSTTPKETSSLDGHRLAATSPFYQARLQAVPQALTQMKEAIHKRDLAILGPLVEAEALSLHTVMMTSRPPLLYWQPATVAVLREMPEWRKGGIEAYFTLDAGPNVHLLTLPEHASNLERALLSVPGVEKVLIARPGDRAKIIDEHLF